MPSNHLILCHPLLLLPSIIPASGSFPISQLFAPGGQSIEVSASTSVPPMNTQDWSSLGWTGWISLQSKGLSGGFSNTTVQSINSSALSFFYRPTHILCFITVLYICQYWSPDPSHSLSPLGTHTFVLYAYVSIDVKALHFLLEWKGLSKLSVYFTWHLYHPHRAQHFLLGIIIFPSPHLDCELWKSKGFLSLHQYLAPCLAHSRTTVNIFKGMNICRWRCGSRCQCYRWLDKSFNFIRP